MLQKSARVRADSARTRAGPRGSAADYRGVREGPRGQPRGLLRGLRRGLRGEGPKKSATKSAAKSAADVRADPRVGPCGTIQHVADFPGNYKLHICLISLATMSIGLCSHLIADSS